MDPCLVRLMEELVASIEQREAADADAPAWEASARIRHLEREIARRLEARRPALVTAGTGSEQLTEPLPGIDVAGSVA